jgi:1-acyl-sn-glycerol-3-phosphate acyltransferase
VRVRKLQQKRGWVFAVGASILKPLFFLTTKPDWIDGDKIPATGGCVLVLNHVTKIDPLTAAHFVYDHGRLPRYLAKADLFKNKALSKFLRSGGQIPVERLTRNAVGAFDAAVAAVNSGECIVVYPEGTITRDPDMWPMTGKSGAARIALATGCPVIPVGHWGAHELLAPYSKKPDLFPRKKIIVKAGDPVDLSDLLDKERTQAVINEATARIMAAITALVEDIRGEKAPAERFDPRRAGVSEIGNPNQKKKSREDG